MVDFAKQEYVDRFPLGDLRPWPGNARVHAKDVISESIAENGFAGAMLVQKSTNRVIAGHGRWDELNEAGEDAGPVILVDVDDETAENLNVVLNRSEDLAGIDPELQARQLERIIESRGSLDGTGYDSKALEELLESIAKPDVDKPGRVHVEFDASSEPKELVCPECGHRWTEKR